ncbi:hypothetical protein PCANC_24480 [Puccinia coronata f. sp. avenae]|uniref:Uncharacterized protein n=1 Tax=Puccinia coronata f. sp. avenae TaxID=200324 RepID=A0A2N5S162_9BASI|nr:hypothetical protein PCANC_24480 [Puccinia coronata f. sp. avenae]
MLPTTPMASLIFSNNKDFMSALEVEEQAELSSVDSGSTYELLTHTPISLASKGTLDEPSVSPTTAANAILRQNRYRTASSELELYLLGKYLPPAEDTTGWPCAFAQDFDYLSDELEASPSGISAHLDNPELCGPPDLFPFVNIRFPPHPTFVDIGVTHGIDVTRTSSHTQIGLVIITHRDHRKVRSQLFGSVSNWPSLPATMDPVPGVNHHPRNQHFIIAGLHSK